MVASPSPCGSSQSLVTRDALGLVVDPVQVEPVVGGVDVRRVADEGARPRRRVERRLDRPGRRTTSWAASGWPGSADSNLPANSKSRWSPHGTAMIAPRAVAHQHVVGDPHRDLFAVDRVDGVRAGEHAGLLAVLVLAVDVLLGGRLTPVLGDGVGVLGAWSATSTNGCSGASTMNVAPNSVSGRVVNTTISPAGLAKCTHAPGLRPIQLRCIVLIASDQSSRSRSSIRRSA